MKMTESLQNFSLDVNSSWDDSLVGTSDACLPKPTASGAYVYYRIAIDIFVVGVLCTVGFVGNALSIAVLRKDRDKTMTNWLLQTLSVADTLYLIACIFFQTAKGINDYTDWWPALEKAMPYIIPYIWAFASITQTITVWLVILVTADRYIAVCKPLNQNLRTLKRAQLAVATVVILAIVYNIPRFFERKLIFKTDKCTGIIRVTAGKTKFRNSPVYILVYKTIAYFIFRAIGPLLTLITLNYKLIAALKEIRRKHRDMTKGSRKQENITLVLIVVVTVFIICMIPDMILRIILTFHTYINSTAVNLTVLRYVNAITNMLLTVNSSINFLVYCLIGIKFRKILKQMCCGKQKGTVYEASESEPLTTKTVAGADTNGTTACVQNGPSRDGDVAL